MPIRAASAVDGEAQWSAMAWVEAVAGVALLLAVCFDLFQSVVLPRPAINKFALVRYLFRAVWRTWRWVGSRMKRLPRRGAGVGACWPGRVRRDFTDWGAG